MAAPVPPGGGGLPARLAPFSTHARGVPLFDWGRFLDLPRHLARILLDLRDLSSSLFWFLSCQTWLTMWGCLVTVVSVTFFTYFTTSADTNHLQADLDWTLVSFTVVLPLTGFIWFAYQRRERCLDELSKVRVLMTSLFTAHRDWPVAPDPAALEGARAALLSVAAAMRSYFPPARFYTKYYPYMGFRRAMVQIALERSRYSHRLGEAFEQLSALTAALERGAGAGGGGGGLSGAAVAGLQERVLALQLALGRMANVKEFRTPQGVRAMARFYVGLFIPIFFGPYWAWVSAQTNFGFAFFFSVVLEIALVGLLNVGLALEDPYDNNGLDGVYIDEALYEVEALLLGDGEDSGEDWAAAAGGGAGVSSSKQQLGPEASAGPPPSPTQQNVTVATDTV